MDIENIAYALSSGDISRANETFQQALKEVKKPSDSNSLQRAKRWAVPYLAAGTALLAVACGPAQATEPTTRAVAESTATPTEVPPTATASPTPELPTPEPTKVPPTPTAEPTKAPTQEAKKDVPCAILPQEYCSQAEVIDLTNSLGQEVKLIGFNLPAGVPLSMPIDGQVAKVKLPEDATDNGFSVQIFDPNNPNPVWYLFKGDMQFDNMFSVNMKKGEVFGHTQNTGIKYRGHQFIFYIIRGLGKESTAAEDELEKMFPEAFTKPTIKVSASKESAGTTIITKTFYDTPPK